MVLRGTVISFTLLTAIAAAGCDGGASPAQPSPGGRPFTVNGVVREKLSSGAFGLPIKGVKVEAGPAISTMTDDDGRYSIAVGGGSLDLTFSREGYRPTTLRVEALSANRSLDAALDPILSTLTGTVIDAALSTPVIGARLEILNGSNQGRSTATDTNGEYRFAGVWGDFDLSVSVVGYEAQTVRAAVGVTATRVDVRLNPDGQLIRTVFTGALCTVAPPLSYSRCQGTSFPYPVQAHHWFTAQRPGTMTLAVSYTYQGDYYINTLSLDLRCENRVIAEKRIDLQGNGPPITQPDNLTGPVQIALPRACQYEIKLFNYIADRKGGDWTTYRVEVGYPR